MYKEEKKGNNWRLPGVYWKWSEGSFSKARKLSGARKAIAKSQNLRLQSCFLYIFWYEERFPSHKKFQSFRYRWTKNGFPGPKSFRGFRESDPREQYLRDLLISLFLLLLLSAFNLFAFILLALLSRQTSGLQGMKRCDEISCWKNLF